MIGYIYLWINKHNNKKYVGQTYNKPSIRWRAEKNAAYNKKQNAYSLPLSRAIRRYTYNGFDRIIIEQIECSSKEELVSQLNELEQFYIWYYRSYTDWNGGYNNTTGGGNHLQSQETIQKKSLSLKNSDIKFRIPVMCIETGVIYKSGMDAAEINNLQYSHVLSCVRHTRKTCGNYHWCNSNHPLTIEQSEQLYYATTSKKPDTSVSVMIIETGDYFNSGIHAQKVTGVNASKISACCKHKRKTSGGYHWCYKNEPLTIQESEQLYYELQSKKEMSSKNYANRER